VDFRDSQVTMVYRKRVSGKLHSTILVALVAASSTGCQVVHGNSVASLGFLNPPSESRGVLVPQIGDEPKISVPLASNWEQIFAMIPSYTEEDEYPTDRLIIANLSIREKDYAPTVIFSLDELPLATPQAAEEYVSRFQAQMMFSAAVTDVYPVVICGRPASGFDFQGLERSRGTSAANSGQMGSVLLIQPRGSRFMVIAVSQTRNAHNSSYMEQLDAIKEFLCLS